MFVTRFWWFGALTGATTLAAARGGSRRRCCVRAVVLIWCRGRLGPRGSAPVRTLEGWAARAGLRRHPDRRRSRERRRERDRGSSRARDRGPRRPGVLLLGLPRRARALFADLGGGRRRDLSRRLARCSPRSTGLAGADPFAGLAHRCSPRRSARTRCGTCASRPPAIARTTGARRSSALPMAVRVVAWLPGSARSGPPLIVRTGVLRGARDLHGLTRLELGRPAARHACCSCVVPDRVLLPGAVQRVAVPAAVGGRVLVRAPRPVGGWPPWRARCAALPATSASC